MHTHSIPRPTFRLFFPALLLALLALPAAANPDAIHEAVAKAPGTMVYVPPGDHKIDRAILLNRDGGGLFGPGRIIQRNPEAHIIEIRGAKDIRVSDLSLTRPEGARDVLTSAVHIEDCERVEIRGLRVLENRSPKANINVSRCKEVTVRDCSIRNYKTQTIDDRTEIDLYRYAFRSVDGTGIMVRNTQGAEIVGNRIIEERYLPTREVRDAYNLGGLTVKPEKPGRLMSPDIIDSGYTCNWHQGAGLQVSSPESSGRVIIRGNYYENAAQGMDIHADHVIIADNMVYRAMIGMKAMHGAKNVVITGNHFTHCDLWGLLLMPGALSHGNQPEAETEEARAANVDGGTIVANNLFSDFGYGGQNWNWEGRDTEYPEQNVIAILFGQLEENPPLRTVLINGNMVYNSAAEGVVEAGEVVHHPPRFNYALYLEETREPRPVNIKIVNNHFEAGRKGVSNADF